MDQSANIHSVPQVNQALKLVPVPLLTLMGSTIVNEAMQPSRLIAEQVEVQDYELGDEVFKTQNRADCSGLYVVCQGTVRLLCTERDRNRKRTVDLLETGASFGLDYWFCSDSLDYEAIAATPCQVAHIPAQKLYPLFQQFPYLQSQLAQQVQLRERLIFFRSLTSVCSMSSRQLKYLFLPQLMEQEVSVGTLLNQVAAEHLGQFWLRKGEIVSKKEIAPTLGESWGHLGRTPTDWIAATDLVLYHIPSERLEVANLLSFL